MLTYLASAILIVLVVIAFQLSTLSTHQRALNEWLSRILKPKEYSFLDELAGTPNPHRSILDQVGAIVAGLDRKLHDADDHLRYLRNYVWEVLDPRFIEDVENPPESSEWKTRFQPPEDPKRYGLWMRERDMSESFHRDVVLPHSRRQPTSEQSIDDAE